MSESSASDAGQVSTQLAVLVPTFDPSTDNVEIWSSKVELLLHAWPQAKIVELVTRLILGCKGTAYQTLQLHQKELLVNDTASVKKVVELVGGTWGAIPLEKKFELVEKALYRGGQKMDESSDSYLSRTDVIWTELLAKGIDLKEIQSYIILRGSKLNSDDKKRVIVESGAEKGGSLELPKVQSAIRMVGSGFFQEMTGAKCDKGLKTYDHTAFAMDEIPDEESPEAFWVQEELDDQTLEVLAAEDDEDAALILQFEDAIGDTIQNDSEMCAFYSAYQEARKRLSEKVRFRGFWSVKKGEKGKKGKSKGKGKGNLASRIANSYCRICLKKGHWKNECPSRNASGSNLSAASSTTVPTTFVVTDDVPEVLINMAVTDESWMKGKLNWDNKGVASQKWGKWGNYNKGVTVPRVNSSRLRKILTSERFQNQLRDRCFPKPDMNTSASVAVDPNASSEIPSLFATTGTVGVVDLGASQTVIGSEQVPELLSNLPDWVRAKTRRCQCNLTFRFGNHQTLSSRHALVLPLGSQSFRIAVVEGKTPFLISNAFLKGLKAVIDTDQETLYSRQLARYFSLQKSNKNLFLMDINQLWEDEKALTAEPCQDVFSENHSLATESKTELAVPMSEVRSQPFPEGFKHNMSGSHMISNQVRNQAGHSSDDQPSTPMPSQVGSSVTAAQVPREQASALVHHGPVAKAQGLPQCHRGSEVRRSTERDPSDATVRAGKGDHPVRQSQVWTDVQDGLRGRTLDGLVCDNIRKQSKDRACQVHHLCDQASGHRDHDGDQGIPEQVQDQAGSHEQQERTSSQNGTVLGGGIGDQRVHPNHGDSTKSVGGAGSDCAGREPQHEKPHDSDRDGHPGAHHPCQSSDAKPVRAAVENITENQDHILWTASDDSLDYMFQMPKNVSTDTFKTKVQRYVRQFRLETTVVSPKSRSL